MGNINWRQYWGHYPEPEHSEIMGVLTTLKGKKGVLFLLPSGFKLGIAGKLEDFRGPSPASMLAKIPSAARVRASRENGKKGGRPRGT